MDFNLICLRFLVLLNFNQIKVNIGELAMCKKNYEPTIFMVCVAQ